MHPKVLDAIEEIDAAIFSGDTFFRRSARETLVDYMQRWDRELAVLADIEANYDGEE